jgi:hypothetical protein
VRAFRNIMSCRGISFFFIIIFASQQQVNKASLRGHYIGLHCESTAKRTAAYAAFVCFQKATEGGGRFLVADGMAILAEIDTAVLQRLYDRQIRISVSNLDIPPALPGFVKEGIKGLVDAAVAPKFDMDLEMIYESDGKPGRLQVRVFRYCSVCSIL